MKAKVCEQCGHTLFGAGYTRHIGSNVCKSNKIRGDLESSGYIRVGNYYNTFRSCGVPMEKHKTRIARSGVGYEYWAEAVYHDVWTCLDYEGKYGIRTFNIKDVMQSFINDPALVDYFSTLSRLVNINSDAEAYVSYKEELIEKLDLRV